MSLKFSDALRLSWSNIAQHKKRSAILVVTGALLAAAVLAVVLGNGNFASKELAKRMK